MSLACFKIEFVVTFVVINGKGYYYENWEFIIE